MPETQYSINAGALDYNNVTHTGEIQEFAGGYDPVFIGQRNSNIDAFYGLVHFQCNQNRFATISSAVLSLKWADITTSFLNLYIYAIAADNQDWPGGYYPGDPVEALEFRHHLSTAGTNVGLPVAGLQAIDVTSAVQEIVNRVGWVPGNKIMFWITWTATGDSCSMRTIGNATYGPKLVISGTGGDLGAGGSGVWLEGTYKAGYYRQSTNTWTNYSNYGGQFSLDDVYFNQSLPIYILPGGTFGTFRCKVSHAFGGSGSPPITARIKAIKNSTSLVTDATSAADGLAHLTTAYLDITIPDSTNIELDLKAIAQEVVNDSHWASGNKITFVCEGTGGFSGTFYALPTWFNDSYTLGGGGGGGGGGQNGVNGSFFLELLDQQQDAGHIW